MDGNGARGRMTGSQVVVIVQHEVEAQRDQQREVAAAPGLGGRREGAHRTAKIATAAPGT